MKISIITLIMLTSLFSDKGQQNTGQITEPVEDFYSLSFTTIRGEAFSFEQLRGKKVLLVNTASKCGFTPQFKELEALHKEYSPNLVILGFPSNDFMKQDPGTNEEILEFCQINYGVTFQMMEKSSVRGKNQNQVFRWLSDKSKNGWNTSAPGWNFSKYLVDEQGRLIGFWPSKVKPNDPQILEKL
ncbi:MAG: glutathione peroxidase [Bacteroidales bacterium]|nr:glutathione peroxidase [Bacteroidales bacterium]MDD4029832.1 glutathione peroxidase [Bacteroidales bacterium]